MKERLLCPGCGEPLYAEVFIDDKTDKIIVEIYCESDSDDEYQLQIHTGLTNEFIDDYDEEGEVMAKEMKIVLKKRELSSDFFDDWTGKFLNIDFELTDEWCIEIYGQKYFLGRDS